MNNNLTLKKIYLYNVCDDYIKFLYQFDKHVCDNKKGRRKHFRKYLGVVLEINGYKYFAPLSSPKEKDYNTDGSIRKDAPFIIRIITENENGGCELKGKILLGNMIPFLEGAFEKYNVGLEKDINYKTLIIKELEFITKNRDRIYKKAKTIYMQKKGYYKVGPNNKYLNCTIDFDLLEKNYNKFSSIKFRNEEELDSVAKDVLKKYLPAFKELAKK